MHHAFNKQRIEGDENAEGGYTRDATAEDLAYMLFDEPALEPGLDIARGIIGPTLARRQYQAQLFPQGVLAFALGQGHRSSDIIQRSEEHTSELQSLMRISYAVFCLKKKKLTKTNVTSA